MPDETTTARKLLESLMRDWDALRLYLVFIGLAILGGLTKFAGQVMRGARRFRWGTLSGELLTSGFAGVMVMLICAKADLGLFWTGLATGIGGHQGAESIYVLESWVRMKAGLPQRERRKVD